MTKTPRYAAPALTKGLEVLELLAGVSEPVSMAAISARTGRSKGEMFRIIQVLETEGYIARLGSEGYVLTNRLFALGMRRPPIRDLVQSALPRMDALAEETDQSCHLAVASGGQMIVAARVEAPGMLGFAVRVGHRRPLPSSASGLVLLAFQKEERRTAMLELAVQEGVRFSRKSVLAAVQETARKGFVQQPSTLNAGVTDLSAPILVHGAARAALTMPFLAGTMVRVGVDRAREALLRAAAGISSTLEFGEEAAVGARVV